MDEHNVSMHVVNVVHLSIARMPLSTLRNIYIEEFVREALEDLEEVIKVGAKWVKDLRLADNQAIMGRSQAIMGRMKHKINQIWKENIYEKDRGIEDI